MNEFMPDIAMGVSAMTLKECRMPEVNMEVEGHDLHPLTPASIPHGYAGRHPHSSSSSCSSSRKRHAAEPKPEAVAPPDFPDLYELSGRHSGPYAGPPDLYSHGRPPVPGAPAAAVGGPLSPSYAPDQQAPCRGSDSGLRLDMLEQPPQRLDLALATHAAHVATAATATGQVAAHRAGRPQKNETDLTCGLGSPPPPPLPPQPPCPPEPYEEWAPARRPVTEGTGGGAEDGLGASRERRSPSKPEYPYRKSAL